MAIRKFQLPYGKKIIEFEVDSENISVLDKKVTPPLSQEEIVNKSLNNSLEFPSFDNFFKNQNNIGIVVPDKTRKSGTIKYLPLILDKLKNLGITRENITLFFANGTHGQMTEDEKIDIVGEKIYRNYRLIEHNCKDEKNLSYIGKTKHNTKIYLNANILKCDRILLTGSINFHYMAGFGGGLKTLIPGLAGLKTTLHNHCFTIDRTRPALNPKCIEGILKENPLFDDIIEILNFIDTPALFNTILNEKGKIIDAVFGHPLKAFKKGCRKLKELFSVYVNDKSDLVIISPGGYPKDINLVQTHKSINRWWNLLNENGVMIVLSECRDGIGSDTFIEWFEYKDTYKMHKRILANFKMNANTALSYKLKASEKRIFLVTELDNHILKKMKIRRFSKFKDALNESYTFLPQNFKTWVIPNASFIFPTLVKQTGKEGF